MIALNTSWNKGYLQKNNKNGQQRCWDMTLKSSTKEKKQNVVTDALSRKDEDVEALLYAISIIQLDWIAEAMDEWKNDEKNWTFIQKLQ